MPIGSIVLALISVAMVQNSAPATGGSDQGVGSISGIVKDLEGTPVAGASVRVPGHQLSVNTSADGRYTIPKLPAGSHSVVARRPDSALSQNKTITLLAGQDVKSVDFHLQTPAEISGRVLGADNEPLPNFSVLLMGRQYRFGVLQYGFQGFTMTDDKGEYRMRGIAPGIGCFLQAKPGIEQLDVVSDIPADPQRRRPVHVLTYFPNTASLDAATPLVLGDGERREAVDIQVQRSPSYCIEGVLEADGAPAILDFRLAPAKPSYGIATFMRQPKGQSGPDGKIRLCDLAPGEHRVTAYRAALSPSGEAFYGMVTFAITDSDVRGVTIPSPARVPVSGRVVWDGTAPEEQTDSVISVGLIALNGTAIRDLDVQLSDESPIPGEFFLPAVRIDEYAVRIRGLPSDLYVKDMTYAGASVLNKALQLGSAFGDAELRIVIGHDAAFLKARLADGDGNPLPDVQVSVAPVGAGSEPDFAAALLSGQTDQRGEYLSVALAPGKYVVIANQEPLDMSPEGIEKLWRARPQGKAVELPPGMVVEVALDANAIRDRLRWGVAFTDRSSKGTPRLRPVRTVEDRPKTKSDRAETTIAKDQCLVAASSELGAGTRPATVVRW